MTPAERIKKIIGLVESGKTLYFSTPYRSIIVTPATLRRYKASGRTLFKSDKASSYIASGRSFLCIDGCKITY